MYKNMDTIKVIDDVKTEVFELNLALWMKDLIAGIFLVASKLGMFPQNISVNIRLQILKMYDWESWKILSWFWNQRMI